ncbi:hypothetical protein PR202_ga24203 [Eleusine coracana subsp. coracana]|uniref:Uncharacterized protein n=1 Tax=Eleusine coracana subsp. coracana TaxID=191504 RepID=A0AAV5D719_ELECO|nr:hypothetical protein QOZ80_1BG0049980 [Eleusine coracana subsp. coracana]GJN06474.1 hypothetical protein PR202_ga24203 [Eleusine coracana subsp. coracana]
MDSTEPADKVAAMEAELNAKTCRISELEARVSLLEAENARLRRTMAKEEAPGPKGEEDPIFGRLEEDLVGHKQTAAEKVGEGGACDVIVLSDSDEGIAIDDSKGIRPEVGVAAVPTPQKHAARVLAGEVEGGSESNKGEARCDSNLCLEDDDVSVRPWSKKRAAAARVVTSDSEDEDAGGGELGCADSDGDGREMGAPQSRKRALRAIIDSDEEDGNQDLHVESEDEDDNIPISQVVKKFRKQRESSSAAADDDEFSDANECSTPPTRRSARLVKNQSKRGQAARRALSFVEPKEYERSDDDTEVDDGMDDFIDDEDSSEHASGSADESCAEMEVSDAYAPDEESLPGPEESDSEIDYADVMASIGRKRNTQDWEFEAEMLAAFDEHPELCLKAVCALYRRQTEDEQREKATFVHNKVGFSQIDAPRASLIAEFLLDGDLYGPLKKTVQDLEEHDRYGLEFCRRMASRYSKQLFAIYQNKKDPYFHP